LKANAPIVWLLQPTKRKYIEENLPWILKKSVAVPLDYISPLLKEMTMDTTRPTSGFYQQVAATGK